MSEKQALIKFHGNDIQTVRTENGIFVVMKPIVENMGLDWKSQRSKFNTSRRWGVVTLPLETHGGKQNMVCIPLKKLNGWLFSINSDKVKDSLKNDVEIYQEECFHVLHNYWFGKKSPQNDTKNLPESFAESLRMLADEVDKNKILESKIEIDKPLVEFASQIKESDDSISIGEFAKILSKNGYEIGQNNLFKKLRELKLIFLSNRKNVPYQNSIKSGLLKLDEFSTKVVKNETKEVINKLCTKITVTGKGQVYISKKLNVNK